ncbi:hypothetical protein KFZ58_07815 [Virgibacillus sp. NKC19-16]|uniref:hypothetical protein n=1 Tax=Virgibacillus salidurans TaxID=2831673 RepID=UPI001F24A6DB|nr:hypothetical protein [Virgibacillus sp. NKC19-16]UJL47751.1 hypothetical protein KFZ58_07815 [Virgibacillus sp. NKC19-16]
MMKWDDSKEIRWGVLLLFGWSCHCCRFHCDRQLQVLEGMNFIIIVLVSTAVVLSLIEITSNMAAATVILPLVASLAIAANLAFMLRVGTSLNAIMFGTGKVKIIEMVKNGF